MTLHLGRLDGVTGLFPTANGLSRTFLWMPPGTIFSLPRLLPRLHLQVDFMLLHLEPNRSLLAA